MEFKVILLCCFLALSCFGLSLADNIEVTSRGETSIANTDDNFICATLDWWPTDKCDYNDCPWHKSGILNLVYFFLFSSIFFFLYYLHVYKLSAYLCGNLLFCRIWITRFWGMPSRVSFWITYFDQNCS